MDKKNRNKIRERVIRAAQKGEIDIPLIICFNIAIVDPGGVPAFVNN